MSRRENGMFVEKGRLRRLGTMPLALSVRALCLLDAYQAEGCTVQAALQTVFSVAVPEGAGKDDSGDGGPDARDRALASELTYGALRYERRLGCVLGRCVRKPHDLPQALRRILQAAAYALLFLERVPHHAVLHTAVGLAGKLYGPRLGGLVNGALRAVQRLGDAPHERAFYDAPEAGDFFADGQRARAGEQGRGEEAFGPLARFYGLPPALAACLAEEADNRPERAEALFRRSAQRPWQGWRINAARPDAAALRAALRGAWPSDGPHGEGMTNHVEQPCPLGDWGFALPPGARIEAGGRSLRQLEADGLLSAQAAGSQVILEELGLGDWVRDGRDIWDACAGQGGKGLALAERGGRLALCTDTSRARLARIAGECARLGLPVPLLALADARRPVMRPGSWRGGIIADVPCSGLGVLARRPDIRRRPLEEMLQLTSVQADIVRGLAACLAPGGELVYLTCTLRREENEAQVEALLRDMPGLICLGRWKTPWDHPWLEGMFGARLRRAAQGQDSLSGNIS